MVYEDDKKVSPLSSTDDEMTFSNFGKPTYINLMER